MTYDNKLLLRDSFGDQKWLDFSAAIGDTWSVSEPGTRYLTWTVSLQSKTDTVVVPAGTFTNCYRFWFAFHGRDNDWVEWYAPGVGAVKRILYGFAIGEFPLTEAMVNEISYPTIIPDASGSPRPRRFTLFQNYPNPFNASTLIRYDLPQPSFVTLEIYNLLGQKVRTLVVEPKPAGRFEIRWDGTDDSGRPAASGIYLYRLAVSKSKWMASKKITLLR